MTKTQLKKILGEAGYEKLVAQAQALRAKGKGPDAIATALRKRFPELAPAAERDALISIDRVCLRKPR